MGSLKLVQRVDQAARGRTSLSILPPWSCMGYRLIQNSALVPKNCASRKPVSAVTE
jgi:hypothetical protein